MRRLAFWCLAVTLAASVPAVAQEERAEASSMAALRVAYLAADGPRVHVRAAGHLLLAEVEAGDVSAYRLVSPGDLRLGVAAAAEDRAAALGPARVPTEAATTAALQAQRYYTLVVTRAEAADGSDDDGASRPADGLRLHVIQDELTSFPAAGDAWVRLVNVTGGDALWSAEAVPTRIESRFGPEDGAGGHALGDEVAPATSGGWTEIPAGTYDVRFDRADVAGEAELTAEIAFHGGALYALYLAPDGPGVALTVAVDGVVRATPSAVSLPPGSRP